jgi:threonylcarbamoyladenosine tRNA methylthiotransferase MtaB
VAISIGDIVDKGKRAERSKMLQSLSSKKRREFYKNNLNNVYDVLWEAEENDNYMYGFTSNYIKVKIPFNPLKINTIEKVKVTAIDKDGICIVECM